MQCLVRACADIRPIKTRQRGNQEGHIVIPEILATQVKFCTWLQSGLTLNYLVEYVCW
jgi:hypothetical protein